MDCMGLFLIESGLVKLTRTSDDGRRFILSVNGPGQLVGEECIAQNSSRHVAQSVCVDPVAGYFIPIAVIERALANSDLSKSVIGYVVARHCEALRRIEMLTLRDVEHRVLYALAAIAILLKPSPTGKSFEIPMTQSEIADFIGATRETTSATLAKLRNRDLVRLKRRLITTVHPDILIRAAESRLVRSGSPS